MLVMLSNDNNVLCALRSDTSGLVGDDDLLNTVASCLLEFQ